MQRGSSSRTDPDYKSWVNISLANVEVEDQQSPTALYTPLLHPCSHLGARVKIYFAAFWQQVVTVIRDNTSPAVTE